MLKVINMYNVRDRGFSVRIIIFSIVYGSLIKEKRSVVSWFFDFTVWRGGSGVRAETSHFCAVFRDVAVKRILETPLEVDGAMPCCFNRRINRKPSIKKFCAMESYLRDRY